MKKYLYIFLSFYIVFFTTTSAYANTSVGGWTATDSLIAGANTTINAAKTAGGKALKSSITVAASASKVGQYLIKGGGQVALAYAVVELLEEGVDWVLDPANNRVKYTETSVDTSAMDDYCKTIAGTSTYRQQSKAVIADRPGYGMTWYCQTPDGYKWAIIPGGMSQPVPIEKSIPIDTVAAKVIANAEAGHPDSQEAVKAAALEGFAAGEHDAALEAAATETGTENPPDTSNPPVTDPNAPPVPFDPSSIISAIKSVMAAVVNMSGVLGAKIDALMIDLGLKQAETIEAITAGTGEIVAANDRTGAKVAEMVAAIEAIEGNTMDGQLINDAIDRVIANDNVKVGDIVAAIEAIEGNTLDGQLINDAIDRVIANDNVNAQAAAEAAEAAEAARTTADQANTTAITDAIDAQTDAMTTTDPTTGETALKLPGFCSWASPVCTFIDWTKAQWLEFVVTFTALKDWLFEDSPANDKDNTVDTVTPPIVPAQVAINFVGSCPAPLTFSFQFYGQNYKPSVPFDPVCEVAILVNPIIKICATIAAAFIAAGIRQGAK